MHERQCHGTHCPAVCFVSTDECIIQCKTAGRHAVDDWQERSTTWHGQLGGVAVVRHGGCQQSASTCAELSEVPFTVPS
jgi:hypothetical protein